MTNYATYPKHRLVNNSCIICFSHDEFSWCMLSNNSRLYLLNSSYTDTAYKIDLRLPNGEIKKLSVDEFKSWLAANSKPKESTPAV